MIPSTAGRALVFMCLAAALLTSRAEAQSLVPAPDERGHDAALAARAEAYNVQLQTFSSRPLGFGLETSIADPAHRAAVEAFFAAGATDFQAHSGMHPYAVVSEWGEFGDLGMFGGVQAAGDAFRYAALRDGNAPAERVASARATLLRAMEGLHWQTQVTGVPGVVARGIRRVRTEPGEPPLAGDLDPTTPLRDASGRPLPERKTPTWRDDASGRLPFLIWLDDASKDQLDGYVFALGVIYDVVADDPSVPRERVAQLVADARAIGLRLMTRVEVAPGRTIDMVIVDADGRPTTFHDLNAEEISPRVFIPNVYNGFNAIMGLGIMRALVHVTGDATLTRFYYEELLGRRLWLDRVESTVHLMYLGEATNFSNVNMAFVAAWSLLRYERDPVLAARLRLILERRLYNPGVPRAPRALGQSFFDFIYAGFRAGGASGPGAEAVTRGTSTLREFPAPPYWSPEVINCDPVELAARRCVAVDGVTTLQISPNRSHGGGVVAVDPLPRRLRPPNNFEWRGDPHAVNGGGGVLLNPGGDFHAAYWMGRFLRVSYVMTPNISPRARTPLPIPTGEDAGLVDAGADASEGAARGEGCNCRATGTSATSRAWSAALGALAAIVTARRRRRK